MTMSTRRSAFRLLMLETLLYVPLVALYYYAVLRLLGHRLYEISEGSAHVYAVVALAILLGQAVVLDAAARILLKVLRR